MAKWGEGDARWIVNEREDGTNINGWHWEERNMMKWSRERIESLLVGADLNVPLTEGRAEIVELTKFEGDSSVSTRKGGKKFGCFDLSFTLKWSGSSGSSGGEEDEDEIVKGEIKVKEFCSTNDEDEYEYTVSASDGKSESKELLKSRIEKSVESVLLPKLRQFCAELKEL